MENKSGKVVYEVFIPTERDIELFKKAGFIENKILFLFLAALSCKDSAKTDEPNPVNVSFPVEEDFVEVNDLNITEGSIMEDFHWENEYEKASSINVRQILKETTQKEWLEVYAFDPDSQNRTEIRQSVKRFSLELLTDGKVKFSVQTTDMDVGGGEATSMRCLTYTKEFIDCLVQLKPNLEECTEDVAKFKSVTIRIKDKYLAWTSLSGLGYVSGPGKSFNSKGNISNFKKAFKIAMKTKSTDQEEKVLDLFPKEDIEFFLK